MKGVTEPRVFTPPLRELTPETTLGFACVEYARTILKKTLYPWQEWALIHSLEIIGDLDGEWRFRFRTVLFLISRQNGKALSLDTEIATPDGWRKMADVHVGDVVFGQDGKPSRVVGESQIFNKPMYLVSFEGGAKVKASADHLWSVQTAGVRSVMKYKRSSGRKSPSNARPINPNGTVDLTTEDMAKDFHSLHPTTGRNQYKYRVPLCQPVEYPPKELPIDPYVLGVWLGDGHSNSTSISVSLSDRDEMIQNLADAVSSFKEERTCWEIKLGKNVHHRNDIREELRRLDLLNNKHIPDIYLQASVEQRLALLQGLMDTDGSCSKAGQCTFSQKGNRFKNEMLELLNSLGIRATYRDKKVMCNGKECEAYEIQFFASKEIPCFRLKRKAERQKDKLTEHMRWKSIVNIERIPDEPSKCIAIDNDSHLYLAGRQYTATHNTVLSEVMASFFLNVLGVGSIFGTSLSLDKAEEVWEAVINDQESISELKGDIDRVSRTNGNKRLILTGLRQYKVGAPTRRAGRGDSNDLVMLDEIREHRDWETWSAAAASTNAKPNGLIVCFSNAGDPDSVVLRQLRSNAIAKIEGTEAVDFGGEVDDALGLFEWSAPEGAATDDMEALAQANPALGYGYVTERALMANRATFPENKFRSECMCQQVETILPQPFPDGAWNAGVDVMSSIAGESELFYGIDLSSDRRWTTIGVCGLREDGNWHVEVVARRVGTEWAIDWFRMRQMRGPMKLAFQSRGAPVSGLAEQICTLANVERCAIEGSELPAGWARFWDGVAACDPERGGTRIYHLPQPVLDQPAKTAQIRNLGGGAQVIDRQKSPDDVAPLMACVVAFTAATAVPDEKKEKIYQSAYSDGHTLVMV